MTSPCGKIRIPIKEEGKEQSGQIQECLDMYHGEGIQHIALGSSDLHHTVDRMRVCGVKLLDTLETCYELIDKRIPGHGEDVAELRRRKILIDGKKGALLLQIFSENQLGPICLNSSSARATKDSARAISGRCSKASSSTRCAVACCRRSRPRPDASWCRAVQGST